MNLPPRRQQTSTQKSPLPTIYLTQNRTNQDASTAKSASKATYHCQRSENSTQTFNIASSITTIPHSTRDIKVGWLYKSIPRFFDAIETQTALATASGLPKEWFQLTTPSMPTTSKPKRTSIFTLCFWCITNFCHGASIILK